MVNYVGDTMHKTKWDKMRYIKISMDKPKSQ